jgi:predicted neutral ceramidase superfamily lipid hydrolase
VDARSRRSSLDILTPYQDLNSEIDNNIYPQLEAKFIDSSRPGSEKKSGLTLSIPNTQVYKHVYLNVYLHAYNYIPGDLVYMYVHLFTYIRIHTHT